MGVKDTEMHSAVLIVKVKVSRFGRMVPIFASLHLFWLLFFMSFHELLGFYCGCTRTSSPHFWGCLLIKPTCKVSIRHLHIHRTFSGPVFPQTFYLCLYVSLQIFHVFPRIFPVIISLWLYFLWLHFHLWSRCEFMICILIILFFLVYFFHPLIFGIFYKNGSGSMTIIAIDWVYWFLFYLWCEDLWWWNT